MTMNDNRKTELKRRIEIADRVLWETQGRWNGCTNWIKDRNWLEAERARLVRELEDAALGG
jgi:hypothetical protein